MCRSVRVGTCAAERAGAVVRRVAARVLSVFGYSGYSRCRYKLQGATAIYDASIDHFDVQLIPSDGVTTINYSVMSCLSIRPLTALGRLRRQCYSTERRHPCGSTAPSSPQSLCLWNRFSDSVVDRQP